MEGQAHEDLHVESGGDVLTISGRHRFDMRDFDVESPRRRGMRVHPDFTVRLDITAERVARQS